MAGHEKERTFSQSKWNISVSRSFKILVFYLISFSAWFSTVISFCRWGNQADHCGAADVTIFHHCSCVLLQQIPVVGMLDLGEAATPGNNGPWILRTLLLPF